MDWRQLIAVAEHAFNVDTENITGCKTISLWRRLA
jgi:hypothetical protein